jgi:hypothetical protein
MASALPFVLVGLFVVGLVAWVVAAQRRRRQARERAVEHLGFSPCPERAHWLEETVTGIESNRGFRYDVRDPRWLAGTSPVYYYVKVRQGRGDEDSRTAEEMLFALKRPSPGGLVLIVKPSSLSHGLATRMLESIATGPWDTQPDDLGRLELPPDLRDTNVVGALGPPGASLYDLIDAPVLGVVQGLGDAGGIFVRFRDAWCTVAGAGAQIPFRLDELVARIRPLL